MATKQNTPGQGVEYEVLVPAFFALNLNRNENVKDFTIRSNVPEEFGNMDDVIIDMEMTDNTRQSFAIQLKHKENKHKKLIPKNFEAKGDFNLKKYYEAFKDIKKDIKSRYHFIIYTNCEYNSHSKEKSTTFTIKETECCKGKSFFNTNITSRSVLKIEAKEDSDYDDFFKQLSVYVAQKNFEEMEEEIVGILKNKGVVLKYLDFFRKWYYNTFTNKIIDRTTLNIHLIDIFLSDFMITDHQLPEIELFQKIVNEFDVTVLNDGFLESKNIDCVDNQEMLCLGKKYKLLDRSTQELDEPTKKKLDCLFFGKTLLLPYSGISQDLIYHFYSLYNNVVNVKFILLGHGLDLTKLSKWLVFDNLEALSKRHETVYQEVIQKCKLSLQGKETITLEKIIDFFDKVDFISSTDIFRMLKGSFVVAEENDSLPPSYIPRKVSSSVLQLNNFNSHFLSSNTVIVDFGNIPETVKKKFIDDHPFVISTDQEMPKKTFDETLETKNTSGLMHLRMVNYDTFVPIMLQVSDTSSFTKMFLDEKEIHEYFNSTINILCGPPGMGKSTMLKVIKNQLTDFWTVLIDLKAHNTFLKTKRTVNEALVYFLDKATDLVQDKIRTTFLNQKKVVFFFDGLDELDTQCVDNILDYTEEISSLGLRVWISSRQNLQSKLASRFKRNCIEISEFSKNEQEEYIRSRLSSQFTDNELEHLIKKIFNSTDIVNNKQVLGVPLQLYIITQIFLDDRKSFEEMTKNIFVLTKMYFFFFEGRYKHTIEKQESKNAHLEIGDPEDHFEKYEILALQSLFDDDVFKQLKLDVRKSQRFVKKIKTDKDPLGIVVKVNNEEKAVFEHFTYAEYFACLFLSNNFDKARVLQEQLFSNRYKNLMLIFNVILAEENPLHLAVIYKDLKQIEANSDDNNILDKGGRSPLHLAVCNGAKYPGCFTLENSKWSFTTSTYLKFLDEMVKDRFGLRYVIKFDPFVPDQLFEWNCLEYAFATKSLVPVEVIMQKHENYPEIDKYLEPYRADELFAVFCAMSGSPKLLSAALKNKSLKDMIKWPFKSAVHITITYCQFQKMETLQFLINQGVDLEFIFDEETPLQVATRQKYLEVVNLLLEHNANIEVRTTNGNTLLHLAVVKKLRNVVNSVAEKVAKVKTDDVMATCIQTCSSIDLVKLFISKGISANSTNNSNETPLHLAVKNEDLEVVKYLCDYCELDQEKCINAKDDNGNTPLHLAVTSGNFDITQTIANKSPTINVTNGEGFAPLHIAVKNNFAITELLIECGADVNLLTSENIHPLHLAIYEGKIEIVKFLLDNVDLEKVDFNSEKYSLKEAVRDGHLQKDLLLLLASKR